MSSVLRAPVTDDSRGPMKSSVGAETERILGRAVLGVEGDELMSMFEIAMLGKLPYSALRDAVVTQPTLTE